VYIGDRKSVVEQRPDPEPPRFSQPKTTSQRLKIVKVESTIAREGRGLWEAMPRIPGGDLVWVVKVENPPDTPCEGYVFARLEFTTGSGEVACVERAYWLGEKLNTTTFALGRRKSVLLGMAGQGCWAYYDNPVDDLPIALGKRGEQEIARQTKRIRQQFFPLTVPVDCHLTVVAENGSRLVEASYRITRNSDGNGATVREINENLDKSA
jgi:hypothetical protein